MAPLCRRGCWIASLALLAGCGGSGFEPDAEEPWAPRPLADVVFERTPEREAHGEYLVSGILRCFVCHSERDWTAPGAPPVAGREGAGFADWTAPRPEWLVAPNLTPDIETGIGTWTDDMLVRAIREGVSHDGRPLHEMMPFGAFGRLSDEDLASVIVYLRSRAPVRNPLPDGTPPATWEGYRDPPPRWEPPWDAEWVPGVARGAYLIELAECAGCHTSWYTPRNPGRFGGGNLIEREDISAYSSNITSSPSGISYYDAALFRGVMRTGKVVGRELSPTMPWTALGNLSDDDLDAIFAFLRAIPPVSHNIDNLDEPTACPVCGGTHPLGRYNRLVDPELQPYSASDWLDAAGAYRFSEDDGDYILLVSVERDQLVGRWEDEGDQCSLVTTDERRFFCEDGMGEFEFGRENGRVTHVIEDGVLVHQKIR